MPHQTLRLQGGTIVNETPTLNATGYAVTNRIRFKYDPQGLSLAEKLGGWSRFFASQITTGVVRALWGWQDTANNQWIGLGIDSTTATQLEAIQCTVSGTTGLTTATGTPQNLMPGVWTTMYPPVLQGLAGSNSFAITDVNAQQILTGTPQSVYISTPISIAGVVLQGLYQVNNYTSGVYFINAFDILGNPTPAVYSTINSAPITGVTFTGGSPNTLTITFSLAIAYPVGENINVITADNKITGSYIILSSASGSVTVATTLSSYTFSTTGTINTQGVTPIFHTASGSDIVGVNFPDHGYDPINNNQFTVLNPTLVGGIVIQGTYTVQSVTQPWQFTIQAASPATSSSVQYQGAQNVTGGAAVSTAVTIDYAQLFTESFFPVGGSHILTQGINPAAWNGAFTGTSSVAGQVNYTDSAATTGAWVSGGSWSTIGGIIAFVYSTNATAAAPNDVAGSFWSLDSWGNDLLGCFQNGVAVTYGNGFTIPYQPVLYWDSTSPPPASVMLAGPPASNGLFVAMPERQIVAWGTTFSGIIDPLLIRWCDINNFNTWVAQIINQAGSFRLPSGSAIIGARQTIQQGLIWTDIELWAMQYENQPYVYGFNKIGQGCGLIGKYAHGVLSGVTYWMSKTQFFMLSGDGVVPIPCPIWDVVFQDLDLVNADKITCATNAMFQEITWYFPVKSGNGENSQYVKLNVSGLSAGQPLLWDYGTLDRSAWLDVSVLQQPIGFSPINEYIYQHEVSPDADGAAMGETFTTGWFSIAEGDVMPFVDQVWPDMKFGYYGQTQNASVTLTISGADFPTTTPQTVGPYTITSATTYISPRIRHRLESFTISGTGTGTWWRLGGYRYRFQPDGRF